MSELAETIERVVREVLARMGHAVTPSAPDVPPSLHAPPSPGATVERLTESEGSLALNQRVVTLADLPEQIQSVRRVVVPCRAVVTPAVRDLLRQRRIDLVFGEIDAHAVRSGRAILAVAASAYDSGPLAAAIEREGYAVERQRHDCLIRATDQLAADVRAGSIMAILGTDHPAAAVCLANRHAGVRAVFAARPDRVGKETESLGANVLVVEPAAASFFVLKRMVLQFLRVGPKPCPEAFQKRLA